MLEEKLPPVTSTTLPASTHSSSVLFVLLNEYALTASTSAAELKNMMDGLISQEEYIKRCDELKKNETTEAYTGEYLFTAKEDFTEEQTVQYFADALRNYAGTQIGMITPAINEQGEFNNPTTGIAAKFYKGRCV